VSFRVKDLTVRYGDSEPPALVDVDLTFEAGVHTAILGPNGAGKSTLLRALLGTVRPERGEVMFRDRSTFDWPRRDMARRVALVSATEEFAFPITVRELVSMGRNPHLGAWRSAGPMDRQIVDSALRDLGILRFSERPITTLSAGELQRARVARALAQQADNLLLDEPVAHLDLAHELSTFQKISQLTTKKTLTTITVTHHLNLASRYCDRVVLLAGGKVIAAGTPASVLTRERLQSTFGCSVEVHDLDGLGAIVVPVGPEVSG
jgi:iron complex transport system ATP-binding protein